MLRCLARSSTVAAAGLTVLSHTITHHKQYRLFSSSLCVCDSAAPTNSPSQPVIASSINVSSVEGLEQLGGGTATIGAPTRILRAPATHIVAAGSPSNAPMDDNGGNSDGTSNGGIIGDSAPPSQQQQQQHRCVLCDAVCDSWADHTAAAAHAARAAICEAFVQLDRSESILSQLERHVSLDLAAVDEVTSAKERRRQSRLNSTLVHLAEEGAMFYSLPFISSSTLSSSCGVAGSDGTAPVVAVVAVDDRFTNFALNGEAYARLEALDRTARLMPATGAADLSAIVAFLLSPRNLSRLYDELGLAEVVLSRQIDDYEDEENSGDCCGVDGSSNYTTATTTTTTTTNVAASADGSGGSSSGSGDAAAAAVGGSDDERSVPPPPPPPPPEVELQRQGDKALVLLACLGELAHLCRQDRSHSVADAGAADILVRHVLASHAVENVISELVHGVMQRVVAEGTPVWRSYKEQSRTIAAAIAAASPNTNTNTSDASGGCGVGAGPHRTPLQPPLSSHRAPKQLSPLMANSRSNSSSSGSTAKPTPTTTGGGAGGGIASVPPGPVVLSSAKALAALCKDLQGFLPLERIGTGSTAVGSKQERLVPAIATGVPPPSSSSSSSSLPSFQRRVSAAMAAILSFDAAPPVGSAEATAHPGAAYAAASPRLSSRTRVSG